MKALKRVFVFGLLLVGLGWPATAAAADKTLLRLRLNGPIMEAPNDQAGLMALLAEEEVHTLHDWVTTLRQAAHDPKIAGLALIIESPQMSFAQAEELIGAVDGFRAQGKPVYCYLDYATNLSYMLAAHADHVTLAEYSTLDIVGLSAEIWYYKGLLDKIGVEADMLRCGAYKSFIEPYTRTEPSPEAAENINWLLDSLYERWLALIAEGRKLPVARVKELVDQAPLSAAQAREFKLVDEVSSFPAFKQRMYKEFGEDARVLKWYEEQTGPEIDMSNPFAFFQLLQQLFEGVQVERGPGVGLIYIEGGIMVGKSEDGMFGTTAGSTSIRAAFEEARADDNVRAVVVRVDSPGGSALASDIIWEAATRCAAEKPLIVSMGGVAGSGGYYVAVPGDVIFADPTTITASIGVGGGKLIWRELLHDKLGITTTEFQRGRHAGLMSMSRKWDESERTWMRGYLDETYDQFKGRIKASRGDRLKKELDDIAGGRVFTGQQALELGLIDKLGGLQAALDYAAEKAGLGSDYEVHAVPEPSEVTALLDLLSSLSGGEGEDEFEIGLLRGNPAGTLLRTALPLARELAPGQCKELLRTLWNLELIQRERVGCFMPCVPQVR